jgi:hypothetical protein
MGALANVFCAAASAATEISPAIYRREIKKNGVVA